MKAVMVDLNAVADAFAAMEPGTKALGALPVDRRAAVSMAISFRRIADALEAIANNQGKPNG